MTKEEILNEKYRLRVADKSEAFKVAFSPKEPLYTAIMQAMDTYAEEQSREKGIAFAEWLAIRGFQFNSVSETWETMRYEDNKGYTTSELYTIFLTETKKG